MQDISAHKGYVKEELRVEAEMRENAIQQLKQDIWNEVSMDTGILLILASCHNDPVYITYCFFPSVDPRS